MRRPARTPGASLARLFVYGTLVDADVRRAVVGRVCDTAHASIDGYAPRDGRHPYLVPERGRRVEGLILSRLTRADFARLDEYEAVRPSLIEGKLRRLYVREVAQSATANGVRRACWIYLPNLRDWPADWR